MKLIDPILYVEDYDGKSMMRRIERACRTCYRSENVMTEDSYKKLLKNCINRGHESILEHEKVSIRMICDIGVYKDLTRHRFASFSIESTRYCNYGKDKFDNEIKFMKPCNIEPGTEMYNIWERGLKDIERAYLDMSNLGAQPDQLRLLLPHATAAEVNMTANIREWKHILSLRANNHAHPSIRQLMIPLLLMFKRDMPEIFDEVEYDEEFPKEKYAKVLSLDKND